MNNFTELDKRIEQIFEKIELASKKDPEYPCGDWPPMWKPPLSEEETAQFEMQHNIQLPEDYRRFITTKAAGGSQPFYGLYSPIEPKPSYEWEPEPSKPFPFTIEHPFRFWELSEEEVHKFYEDTSVADGTLGCLFLCTEGCGMDNILIVNTADPTTYGTVWFYDLSNDYGVMPILHPKTQKPFHFLDWLEYWADQTLYNDEEDYFSYGELTISEE